LVHAEVAEAVFIASLFFRNPCGLRGAKCR